MDESEKQKYIKQGKHFHQRKGELEEIISQRKSEIDFITNQIHEARPKTPKGKYLCDSCDIISMVQKGYDAQGEKNSYECEICGRNSYITSAL
jgi:rubrerythrin